MFYKSINKNVIITGDNMAVPLMEDGNETNSPMFVHLRQLICPLEACKRKGRSKLHTLLTKAKPLCLHTIVGLVSNVPAESTDSKLVDHQIDFKLTVNKVIHKVKNGFPTSFRLLEEGSFLVESKTFVAGLLSSGDNLEDRIPQKCDTCHCDLEDWKRKPARSYLISLGAIKKITIPVKRCPKCSCAFYPDIYSKGVICIHNKIMLSADFLLDLINVLKAGGGMIETIQLRLKLLGSAEGWSVEDIEKDITSLSIKLEKAAIAFASVLIGESDLEQVSCYLCGACPKIVSSGM